MPNPSKGNKKSRNISGSHADERKTGLEPATPDLGKVVLYQLSYFRIISNNCFVLTVQR